MRALLAAILGLGLAGCTVLSRYEALALAEGTPSTRRFNGTGGYSGSDAFRTGPANTFLFSEGDVSIEGYTGSFLDDALAQGPFFLTIFPILPPTYVSLAEIKLTNRSASRSLRLMSVRDSLGRIPDTLRVDTALYFEERTSTSLDPEGLELRPGAHVWIRTNERRALNIDLEAGRALRFHFRKVRGLEWGYLAV